MKHFRDRVIAGGEPFEGYKLPIHGDIADVRVPSKAKRPRPQESKPPDRKNYGILRAACNRRGLWMEEIVADVFRVKWRRDVKISTEILAEGNFAEVIAVVDRMALIETG